MCRITILHRYMIAHAMTAHSERTKQCCAHVSYSHFFLVPVSLEHSTQAGSSSYIAPLHIYPCTLHHPPYPYVVPLTSPSPYISAPQSAPPSSPSTRTPSCLPHRHHHRPTHAPLPPIHIPACRFVSPSGRANITPLCGRPPSPQRPPPAAALRGRGRQVRQPGTRMPCHRHDQKASLCPHPRTFTLVPL